MKTRTVIIGGGVAGLAIAIALRKQGLKALLCERSEDLAASGMGFILMPNGLAVLDELGLGNKVRALGKIARRATIKTPGGQLLVDKEIPEHLCLQRGQLIRLLRSEVPSSIVCCGKTWVGFNWDETGQARSALFADGSEVPANLFVAADGRNSQVRRLMFPQVQTSPVCIKEMLSMVSAPTVAERLEGGLLKYQDDHSGLAVGMASVGRGQVIWYLQFDCLKQDLPDDAPEAKRAFVCRHVGAWPQPIPELLAATDFSQTRVWRAIDMDLLPTFHTRNVVLAGDAAHVVLSLTGQGANAALEDALALAHHLRAGGVKNVETAFTGFYNERRPRIEEYLRLGRDKAAQLRGAGSGPAAHIPPALSTPSARDYVR